MPPPSKKTPPPRFDPGILQGLQEPLTVSVSQLRSNNRTPIQIPAKDGTDMQGMPGSGWTRDGVARLNTWIEEKHGPGVYEVIVVDSVNAQMEWNPLFMTPPVRPFAASAPPAPPPPVAVPTVVEAPPPPASPLPSLPFYPYQPVNMSQILPPTSAVGLNQYGQPVYGYPLPSAPAAAPVSPSKERADRDRDLEAELRRAQADAAQAKHRAEFQQQEAVHAAAMREMELKFQQAQAQQAQIAQQQAQAQQAQVPRIEDIERRLEKQIEALVTRLQPPPRDDSEQRLQALLAAERQANEQRLAQMEAAHKADRDRQEARIETDRMRQEAREREERLRAEMAQLAQQQQQQMATLMAQIRDQSQNAASNPMMDLVRVALTNQTESQRETLRIAQAAGASQITPMQILTMVREASAPGSMLTTGITQAYADVFGLLKGAVTQMAQLQGGEASPVPQMIGEGMHTISSIAERWMKGRETQVQADAQARIAASQAAAIHEQQETQRVAITHGVVTPSQPQIAQAPPPAARPSKPKKQQRPPAQTPSQELSGAPVATIDAAPVAPPGGVDQMPSERELLGLAYESVLNLRRGVVLFLTHAPDLTSEVRDTAGAVVGLSPRAAVDGILEGVRQVGLIPAPSRPPVFDLLSRDVDAFITALLPDGGESVKITQAYRDACVALLNEHIQAAQDEVEDEDEDEEEDEEDGEDADSEDAAES